MKSSITILIVFSILLTASCRDRDEEGNIQDRVPNVPVNISINVLFPEYFNLQTPGGWEYLNGGSMGIIVYRLGPEEFKAYDRHCTWNVADRNRISVTDQGIIAADSICGSSFVIIDGTVVEDPAFVPLTEYRTTFNSATNWLTITN